MLKISNYEPIEQRIEIVAKGSKWKVYINGKQLFCKSFQVNLGTNELPTYTAEMYAGIPEEEFL